MISIIIPTYNRESSIFASVESVLSQTYCDIELIIVDDGSTDNTEQVIKNIKDDRIRYVRQNNNGACAARNYGICLARGDFIAFQDSDDIWHKEKLERQLGFLLENKADVVFCKMVRKSNDDEKITPWNLQEGRIGYGDSLRGIGTQSLLMKAEIAKHNLFDIDFPRLQDLEWLLRANEKTIIYCMDEVLVDYYVGEDSISTDVDRLYTACKLLLEKDWSLIKKYPLLRIELSTILKEAGYKIKKTKEYPSERKKSVKFFALAVRLHICYSNVKAFGGAIKSILLDS